MSPDGQRPRLLVTGLSLFTVAVLSLTRVSAASGFLGVVAIIAAVTAAVGLGGQLARRAVMTDESAHCGGHGGQPHGLTDDPRTVCAPRYWTRTPASSSVSRRHAETDASGC